MNDASEWSIQDLAKAAGVTSRTLRHYGQLGLLEPTRIGSNGYRYYDRQSLARLQRILLLRELGVGLPVIGDVLRGEQDAGAALRTHVRLLEQQRDRLDRQMVSVRTTLDKVQGGEPLVVAEVFDGFEHTRYEDEVIERWGAEAYRSGDRWWRALSEQDRTDFYQRHVDIAADYGRAHRAGLAATDDEVQALMTRHHDWLAIGTQGRTLTAEYVAGLGQMYVDDPRFRRHYDVHGAGTAEFVRDALRAHVDRR